MALRNSLWLGALFAGAVAITYSSLSGESSFKAQGHRKAAPDFALQDAQGSELKLSEYRGKVVLVNFWATWCGP